MRFEGTIISMVSPKFYNFKFVQFPMSIRCKVILPVFLSLLVVCISACRDEAVKTLPIAGNWSISQAVCDNVDQPVWTGKMISFKQLSADSGIYEFPETPYDSVWNKSGTWKVLSDNDFLRYDVYPPLACSYRVSNNTLSIVMLLPCTSLTQNQTTNPIPPIVNDNWTFTFQKK